MWKVSLYREVGEGWYIRQRFKYEGSYLNCLEYLICNYELDRIQNIKIYDLQNTWYRKFCRNVRRFIMFYFCLED